MTDTCLYWFEDLGKQHNDMVGKKCANLGEMAKIGIPIPHGFALSLDAYRKFLTLTGAAEEVEECIRTREKSLGSISAITDLSKALRQVVESKPMPSEMEEAITRQYQELCRRCSVSVAAVATRSAGAVSHPGQYETHLNVKGTADLLRNIKKVWGSTFNPTSLSFRHKQGLPLGSDPIGVAVLKMINARAAGIVFTADPNSGDTSRMVVEANWGLGESVVGGESMPETFIVEKRTFQVIERRLGTKLRCVMPGEDGVVEQETPSDKCSTFCVSDEEIVEIAKVGVRLEEHFGVPQDVEWAIDDDLSFPNNLVLLQTRPEVIAKKKAPVDQVLDLMMNRYVRS